MPTAALYVRLPPDKLDRAAEALPTNKKALVTTLASHYVDPDSAEGLDRLRDLATRARRVTIDRTTASPSATTRFTPSELPDVLTPAQAASLLQVTEDEIVTLAEAGELPGRRIGDHWRFARPALIAWLFGA